MIGHHSRFSIGIHSRSFQFSHWSSANGATLCESDPRNDEEQQTQTPKEWESDGPEGDDETKDQAHNRNSTPTESTWVCRLKPNISFAVWTVPTTHASYCSARSVSLACPILCTNQGGWPARIACVPCPRASRGHVFRARVQRSVHATMLARSAWACHTPGAQGGRGRTAKFFSSPFPAPVGHAPRVRPRPVVRHSGSLSPWERVGVMVFVRSFTQRPSPRRACAQHVLSQGQSTQIKRVTDHHNHPPQTTTKAQGSQSLGVAPPPSPPDHPPMHP